MIDTTDDEWRLIARYIRCLLHYDPSRGLLTWRVSKSLKVKPGDIAGFISDDGCRYVSIDGRRYTAPQLICLIRLGRFPAGRIVHADGNLANDKWRNIKPADQIQRIHKLRPATMPRRQLVNA
jgi:hypothetical protein